MNNENNGSTKERETRIANAITEINRVLDGHGIELVVNATQRRHKWVAVGAILYLHEIGETDTDPDDNLEFRDLDDPFDLIVQMV